MNKDVNFENRIRELESECIRLKKINTALMNRVEHSTDNIGSSFSLFETNLLLNNQIKKHTSQLLDANEMLQNEIKERKKAELNLKLEKEFIDAIFNTADIWIIIFDKNLNLIRVNKTFESSTKLSSDKLYGKNIRDLFCNKNKALEIESLLKKILSKTDNSFHELYEWHIDADNILQIAWSFTTLNDDYGQPEYIIACGLDVTEYKKLQDQRQRIDHKYHNMLDFLPQTVYERDEKGYISFFNKYGFNEFGITNDDLKNGFNIESMVAPDERQKAFEKLTNLPQDQIFADEFVMQRKDGSVFPGLVYASYLTDENGGLKRCGIVINLSKLREAEKQLNNYRNHLEELIRSRTEELSSTIVKLKDEVSNREQIEEDLRISEKNYRELVQNANSIILKVNIDGICTFFNEFGQSFFGFTEEEIIGKKITDTIVPLIESSSGRTLQLLMRDIFRHPEKFSYNENENIKKSGERVWIAWNNRPIYDKNNKQRQILCVGTDITARKKAEEALKSSETKYRFLFEDSPAGSIIIGIDGQLKDVNKSFLQNLGYSREDLIGKAALDYVAPEQRETALKRIYSLFKEINQDDLDFKIIAKDNSIHYIRFSGKASIINENQKVVGILANGVDVTEKLKAEELNRQQQQNLIQADKMATLGILVSGVAHEINNPNNFILLNSNNLNDVWNDIIPVLDSVEKNRGDFTIAGLPYSEIRDDIAPLITGITEGAERIRRIVQSLKDFSRKDTGTLNDRVNIKSIIETSMIILNNLIKKSTNFFKVDFQIENPVIRGNFQQIEQVIINLITNSCQALTSQTQAITVTVSENQGSNLIIIEVKDEGKGIVPEHIHHIMDPFFTTKRDTGGTGLGLSISYNIIKDHNGDLVFESEVGHGTIAKISLPSYR